MRNRADHHLTNVQGKAPLDIAVESENADIVTLLRLATMDEEMRNENDDSFQEIVRDIAQKAYDCNKRTSTLSAGAVIKEEM